MERAAAGAVFATVRVSGLAPAKPWPDALDLAGFTLFGGVRQAALGLYGQDRERLLTAAGMLLVTPLLWRWPRRLMRA